MQTEPVVSVIIPVHNGGSYLREYMLWFRLAVQRGSEAWKLPRTLVGLLGSAVTSEGRGEKVRLYAKGVAHGLLGRLGTQVRPPQARDPRDTSGGPRG